MTQSVHIDGKRILIHIHITFPEPCHKRFTCHNLRFVFYKGLQDLQLVLCQLHLLLLIQKRRI